MQGTVNAALEAVIVLRLRGATGVARDVEAVIDTGFNGTVCLPAHLATAIGMVRLGRSLATLADGTEADYEVFAGELEWFEGFEYVIVTAVGDSVLLGMSQLLRSELRIEVKTGGAVEINQLP